MSPPEIDFSQYVNEDAENITSHSDDSLSPSAGRVEWSDEDDPSAAYKKFKRRKTVTRAKDRAAGREAKEALKNPTIVGRKSAAPPRSKRYRKDYRDQSSSDSDDSAIENARPAYLKQRQARFDKGHKRHGQEGLNLPPLYDDVYFSDDDDGQLQVKPHLPHLQPQAPYKDIELRYSAGIIPAPIAQWLRPYQVAGTQFLHELFIFQRGGILGDDMGLGKTIQVISFLTAAFGKTGDERDAKRMRKIRRMAGNVWFPKILIICPGSLMENWRDELNTWGWWNVRVYHGTERDSVLDTAKNGRLEIMITTYDTYKNHMEAINLVDWDACIADECHRIKDKKSETTKSMDKVNALCRIGLTGTAIQNKYEELWTLLNWTNPGRFGPLSAWKASISEPLKMGQSHDATNAQLATARKTAKKLVQNLLPQFFLRRMKSLIADQLPKKTDKVVFCPLTEIQSAAYERLAECEITETIRRQGEICDCGSGKKRGSCCYAELSDGSSWRAQVFPMLAILQKLSNHLAMLLPSGTDNPDKQSRDLTLLQTALPSEWATLYKSRDSIMNFANQSYCGKWRVLRKLLRFWHQDPLANNKVLVFSHSVRLLKMLHMLFQSTTSYNVSYLDGGMSYDERHSAVTSFNASPEQFVFLISTKAGGVGLNITSANKVVVFDPNWNPAFDLQAQDRAYRIGQTRDVEVYRLVSQGTVEEIVYARQIYKQQQANIAYEASNERRYFRGVQGTSDKRGEIFGLANIFAYQGENLVLRDIVNRANVAESRAGVSVVELGESQATDGDDEEDMLGRGEREDEAMTKMAESLIKDEAPGKRKREREKREGDAVAAILAGVGVEYTHENSEVIGSSKMEMKLSKRAEEAASATGQEYVFARSQGHREQVNEEAEDDEVKYRFRPLEAVRKRQFVTLAGMMGYTDATEFALVVEGWTQGQRRDCLDRFYSERRKLLRNS